jgi:molecular chaperone GrpE
MSQDQEIKQLEKDLEEVKKQAQEYLAGWQRAKADYINREREIEKDKSLWMEFMALDLLMRVLPISESLEAAMKHKDKKDEFIKGVEQIQMQLEDLIKRLGVERIKTIGEKFDPELHEVVEKKGEGTEIIEEVSPGYKMGGKVVKPAKVIIK